MEDSQRLSRISAGTRYHEKRTSEWYAAGFRVRGWQQQGVWGWWHLGQRGLCQRVSNRSAARALLSGLVEGLPWGGEYLGACIGNPAPLKARHRLPQRQSRKANSNICPRQYGSIDGQTHQSTNSWVHGGSNKETQSICWVHHYHHCQASKKVLNLSSAWFLLGFPPKKYLTYRVGGFSPITLHRSFGFSP